MSKKATIFNPAALNGGASDAKDSAGAKPKAPYETTGVSARDSTRKMLYDTFVAEGHDGKSEAAIICVTLEQAITDLVSDSRSRDYRDKAR